MTASAATINEGDIITGPDGIKVYIVNAFGFKRHIFNPVVFEMYGHLKWSNIKSVDQATLDTYKTSDLYRVAGDPKVFSVTDDGYKHHLNMTAEQFVASGYSWDQIFIINEKEGNYYQTGADLVYTGTVVTPTPTPGTGVLSVSLASDNPAASIIPAGVTGATYLKFNVSGISTINEIVLKRTGIGLPADFSNVYLYDGATRLTSGKTISTDSNTATFVNLGLAVGSQKTLTVKVDVAAWATVTGRQDRLEVYSINGTVVSGVAGNLMSYANVAVATATIAETSTSWNVTLGSSVAEVAKFSIAETLGTAGDLSLRSITLRNSGTLSNSYLKNLVLKTSSGTELGSVASMSGDKAIITLTTPYTIPKSQTKNFVLYGDITGGRANDTMKFYVDQDADLDLIDATYGYGADLTNNWASGDQTVTAAGGQITLGFNGPAATTYAKDTTGQDLLKFSLTSEKNVSVEKTMIAIGLYLNGTLLANTTANDYDSITNIRLVDLATGNTLVGPLTDASVTYTTNDATYGGYKLFTDKFDLTAGTTKQYAIRADIKSTLSTAVANSIKAFVSFGGLAGTTTNYMYDTDASEYVAVAKIVPSTQLGNTITIGAASLTATLASTPVSATFVKGATNVSALGIILTAGSADAAKLTKLVVRAYADETTTGVNSATGSVAANTLVSTASLYDDAGTLIEG
ncbi:MAG: hypothetical protein PHC43_05140, partial [Candidatus Marinimicrobia bacterium]|nr:hypothetical protein [Candidatus Neomarinimicrobiota bacterium]